MKNLNKLAALGSAGTLALSLTACGQSTAASSTSQSTGSAASAPAASQSEGSGQIYRTLDEIKSSGEINIGVFSDKNPFGYVDENGEYQGYDYFLLGTL